MAIELSTRFTLFSKMPEALRTDVCKLVSLSVVPKHSVLYRKGDDANKSFLLMDGTVSMWRTPAQENSSGGGLIITPPGTPRSIIGGVASAATTPSRTTTRHSGHSARVVLDQPTAADVTEGLEYDCTVVSGAGAGFGEQPIRTTRAITAATDERLCVVVMIPAAAYQSLQKRHHQVRGRLQSVPQGRAERGGGAHTRAGFQN
jgi:CRP-like cAMP-binding protein